jgi:hypothetical protein
MKFLKKIGKTVYSWWMKFAHLLAFVNTRILLSIIFVLIIGPIAVISRLLGADFLGVRRVSVKSFWKVRESIPPTIESARRQF